MAFRRVLLPFVALGITGCIANESEDFAPFPGEGAQLNFVAADGEYRLDYEVVVNECGALRPSGSRVVEVVGTVSEITERAELHVTNLPPSHLGREYVVPEELWGGGGLNLSQSPEVQGDATVTITEASPTRLVMTHSIRFERSEDDPVVPPAGCRIEQRWVLTKL